MNRTRRPGRDAVDRSAGTAVDESGTVSGNVIGPVCSLLGEASRSSLELPISVGLVLFIVDGIKLSWARGLIDEQVASELDKERYSLMIE